MRLGLHLAHLIYLNYQYLPAAAHIHTADMILQQCVILRTERGFFAICWLLRTALRACPCEDWGLGALGHRKSRGGGDKKGPDNRRVEPGLHDGEIVSSVLASSAVDVLGVFVFEVDINFKFDYIFLQILRLLI